MRTTILGLNYLNFRKAACTAIKLNEAAFNSIALSRKLPFRNKAQKENMEKTTQYFT